jgi:hypothetical protein
LPRGLEGELLYQLVSGTPISGICLYVDEASTQSNFTGYAVLQNHVDNQTQIVSITNQDLDNATITILATGALTSDGKLQITLAGAGGVIQARKGDFTLLCQAAISPPSGANDRAARTNFGIIWLANGNVGTNDIARWTINAIDDYVTVFNGPF